jgi:pimeloyl-ACP methyl ester carboxylesterase
VKEYPVFVPFGQDHLASVITVPDGEPRALIAVLQGAGGAPRSYYNSTWTLVSRELAGLGFATVRLDWPGVGDSTGDFLMMLERLPLDQAEAAIRLAMDVTSAERLGFAGICAGANISLELSERFGAACQSFAIIKLLIHNRKRITVQDRRKMSPRRRVSIFASRHPGLERVLRRYYWRSQVGAANPLLVRLARVRVQAPVMITAFKGVMRLSGLMQALQRRYRTGPFEVRELPLEGPLGLQDRIGYQRALVTQLAEWFDRTLPQAPTSGDGRGRRTAPSPAPVPADP